MNFIRWISAGFLDLVCELYSLNICRFFGPHLWTLFNEYLLVFLTLFVNFIRWISAGFLNLICELYWQKNKVKKTGRFIRWISAGFLNLIYELYLFKKWQIHDFIYELYSMNICWFLNLICELYLFDEYRKIFMKSTGKVVANTVHKYSSQIRFKKLSNSLSKVIKNIFPPF